jgi:hypothetical protein
MASAAVSLVPALLLAFGAIPRVQDGLGTDAAIPVPSYMIAERAMPRAAYVDAIAALSSANPRNGDARIARAEAGLHAGAAPAQIVPEAEEGLASAPASARGWLVLSVAELPGNRRKAAQALSQALLLAPRDYWLVGPRAQMAAALWPEIDQDSRIAALAQARMLWEEPPLRSQLEPLLNSVAGVALARRAFAGRGDELRAMNRWLAEQRRRRAPP